MDQPLSLTLLYTGQIAGDLALLPRLYTFIQQLKAAAHPPAPLLDLGGSCADDVPHCRETGGRSTLIALDGMGYHAANVAGLLVPEQRERLAQQVTLGLVNEERDWLFQSPTAGAGSISATLRPRDDTARLQILLKPAECTRIVAKALFLEAVDAGQVGVAVVDLRGEPALISARIHQMPAATPPNASIAGLVDFVEAEARYFARQAR